MAARSKSCNLYFKIPTKIPLLQNIASRHLSSIMRALWQPIHIMQRRLILTSHSLLVASSLLSLLIGALVLVFLVLLLVVSTISVLVGYLSLLPPLCAFCWFIKLTIDQINRDLLLFTDRILKVLHVMAPTFFAVFVLLVLLGTGVVTETQLKSLSALKWFLPGFMSDALGVINDYKF